MDVVSVALVWVSIGIALIVLLKVQAENLANMKLELRESQVSLSANAAQLMELSSRLENVNVAKTGVLIQISQELRAPLAAIKSAAMAIQECADNQPATAATFSQKILRESDRLGAMIESLLGVMDAEAVAESD